MTFPDFTKLSVHVTHGCGSVLLCQHYDKLCTSSCVDHVMFAQCTMARNMRQKATNWRAVLCLQLPSSKPEPLGYMAQIFMDCMSFVSPIVTNSVKSG